MDYFPLIASCTVNEMQSHIFIMYIINVWCVSLESLSAVFIKKTWVTCTCFNDKNNCKEFDLIIDFAYFFPYYTVASLTTGSVTAWNLTSFGVSLCFSKNHSHEYPRWLILNFSRIMLWNGTEKSLNMVANIYFTSFCHIPLIKAFPVT